MQCELRLLHTSLMRLLYIKDYENNESDKNTLSLVLIYFPEL